MKCPKGLRRLVLVIGAWLSTSGIANAEVPTGYRLVASDYDIPAEVLYAVGLAESARRVDSTGTVRPWPWTLNVQGKGFFYASRAQVQRALDGFLDVGFESIDIGLMQVNWRYHQNYLESPQLALDPYHNLRVAAKILRECHQSRQDWWEAVGCYHAPNNPHRADRYRARVFKHWQRVTRRG
ncbi:MAG: lytic transglycosylase domain-containing protein [Chromatiaceae bacterium]|nr:lytic transglycosylase domain-containing protein [Chromatiaceae bacterium]